MAYQKIRSYFSQIIKAQNPEVSKKIHMLPWLFFGKNFAGKLDSKGLPKKSRMKYQTNILQLDQKARSWGLGCQPKAQWLVAEKICKKNLNISKMTST